MAHYFDEPSHTFSEYLLVPSFSSTDCKPQNVSLKTPVCKFKVGEQSPLNMSIPLVSAVMQSVSGEQLAAALAREGGISFLFVSQPIDSQAEMVRSVKKSKSGFVRSDSNVTPAQTMADVMALKTKTGHSTVAVTEDGTPDGKLLGIVTSRDYRPSRMGPATSVRDFMTPVERLVYGDEGITLSEANDVIWEHKLNALPIVAKDGRMVAFVFRKDYDSHKENPGELLDAQNVTLLARASTRATTKTASPLWSKRALTCFASTRRKALPSGRRVPSHSSARAMATASKLAQVTLWMETVSATSRIPARIL